MKNPKISIVVPSFNSGKYIKQTLESIVNQNYKNLELIVIDGGSSDNTLGEIENYSEHITYYESKPDRGQTHAINKGFEKCTGEIFYWINADDYLEPDVLQKVADEYSQDIDVLCVTNRAFKDKNNETLMYFSAKFYNSIEKTIPNARMSVTIFYRRQSILDCFPLSEKLHYAMDFELYFKYIFKHGVNNMSYSNIPVVTHFRLHEQSKTESQRHTNYPDLNALHYSILNQIQASDYLKIYLKEKDKTENYIPEWDLSKTNCQKLQAYYAQNFSLEYYIQKKYTLSKKCILYAFKNGVFSRDLLIRAFKVFLLPSILLNKFRQK